MSRQITCECSFVVRAETDQEALDGIREHMRADHPELLEKVSDEQIRDWIEIVS